MSGTLKFWKYEGLGNDFVLVDEASAQEARLDSRLARAICDRHRGVGADGVLVVGQPPSMLLWNADGSQGETCGNGLRCVALHLARLGLVGPEMTIETAAGPHHCRVEGEGDTRQVRVEMAAPSLRPADLPVRSAAPLIDSALEVAGAELAITAVSMGNPHVVTFDGQDRADELGPLIGAHDLFPEGVNVGFGVLRQGGIDLRVFERGAGWTQACGSGACAAAVAAVETGRLARGAVVPIWLPGGMLQIEVREPGEKVVMTGPARHVFDGELLTEAMLRT